ncbi:MAG: hypothetical protein IJF98_06665, partial [Firmicutes bacterium]|nr:hypothetical protein [Bacillota bacterium]
MKKKLAILLAAVMVAGVVPMTALAGSTTYVNKTVTVSKGDFTDEASLLVIKDNNNDITTALNDGDDVVFTLELAGSEWMTDDEIDAKTPYYTLKEAEEDYDYDGSIYYESFTKVSSTKATVEIIKDKGNGGYYYIPLYTKIKDKGDVTVTVDGKSSVVSSATCTYAVCTSGSATAKIAKTVNIPETGAKIKDITISETTPGALDDGEIIKLKLSKNFKFDLSAYSIKKVLGDAGAAIVYYDDEARELQLKVSESTTTAMEYIIKDLIVVPDDAKVGAVAEITISGAGITKTTLEVGTYVDYGTKIAIYDEDEEIPTFYAGKVYSEEDDKTLAIQISENVADSINTGR